ncbi:hypothetical protein EV586_102559 [Tumebacillus sp. BK434]|nr:hypothetical protein EV586_102559 [Tumebacillus sp. BK434]
MLQKIITALLSTILLCTVLAIPGSLEPQSEANSYTWSFSSLFLLGIPLSLLIDRIASQRHVTSPLASYFFQLSCTCWQPFLLLLSSCWWWLGRRLGENGWKDSDFFSCMARQARCSFITSPCSLLPVPNYSVGRACNSGTSSIAPITSRLALIA